MGNLIACCFDVNDLEYRVTALEKAITNINTFNNKLESLQNQKMFQDVIYNKIHDINDSIEKMKDMYALKSDHVLLDEYDAFCTSVDNRLTNLKHSGEFDNDRPIKKNKKNICNEYNND